MSKPKLAVIVGSVRPNRFADHPAQWIAEHARKRSDFDVEIVDLKDYPLPLFAEPTSPAYGPSQDATAQRWQKKVAEFDAYIFTVAEYNRGPTAVLKNALDYSYREWNNKPVGFVGYGGVGGARAVEQLRLTAVELEMAPVRHGVHIQTPVYLAVAKEGQNLADFDHLNQSAKVMLDQLAWWTRALKAARETSERRAAA
jgi:NAD(P)H-dependent FMN reductase